MGCLVWELLGHFESDAASSDRRALPFFFCFLRDIFLDFNRIATFFF